MRSADRNHSVSDDRLSHGFGRERRAQEALFFGRFFTPFGFFGVMLAYEIGWIRAPLSAAKNRSRDSFCVNLLAMELLRMQLISKVPSLLIKAYGELPPKNRHYAYIGRIASAWSLLEHDIDTTIAIVAGIIPSKCACITSQMIGPGPRLRALIALLQFRKVKSKHTGKLTEFMNKAHGLARSRNRVVHDPWYLEGNSRKVYQFESSSASGVPKYGFKPVKKKEVIKLLSDIREHRDRFIELRRSFLAELKS